MNVSKPFGLKEVVFQRGDTVVAFPISQELTFEERVKSAELEGDDALQAIASSGNGFDWQIKGGGMPVAAYALATGRTLVETGVSPDEVTTLPMAVNEGRFPYFNIFGKSLGDGEDDIHVKLTNAKITKGIKGAQKLGEFMMAEFGGVALDMEPVLHETATDLDVETS